VDSVACDFAQSEVVVLNFAESMGCQFAQSEVFVLNFRIPQAVNLQSPWLVTLHSPRFLF